MANFYEILLVPTDVDNDTLRKRYKQLEYSAEDEWPIDPYHPMDLDLFLLAYQTLIDPAKRAAYDQQHDIIPQPASFTPCLHWTPEQFDGRTGRTPGPYFAHIGIANLLNGGQIDFINGYQVRYTHDKQLVVYTPDGDLEDTKIDDETFHVLKLFPGCKVSVGNQYRLVLWLPESVVSVPQSLYAWHADTNMWFEHPQDKSVVSDRFS